MSTLVLYGSPSTASLAVHWMLIELGLPFELRMMDIEGFGHRTPEYLALNPAGHVPTLVVDGEPYQEVAALLMVLAERAPERGFAPEVGAPERADYLRLMLFMANTMQPAYRGWFYADEVAGPEAAETAQANARQKIEAAWARMDARLSDGRTHLLGDQLSAADFLGTMLARWSRNMPRPATDWPHVRAYVERMRTVPSLIEVHAREGLDDWISG